MVTYDAQELHDRKLLIYLYSLRTAKSNIIFYISKKIHMIFFISLNKNYVLKLEFRKYFIDVYTTRLKIFFCKESSCGEIWHYISHFYPSLKAPVCQWVSEWVSECVCLFPNSSETANPSKMKYWVVIPLGIGKVLG